MSPIANGAKESLPDPPREGELLSTVVSFATGVSFEGAITLATTGGGGGSIMNESGLNSNGVREFKEQTRKVNAKSR
jgi:hypothetical protein